MAVGFFPSIFGATNAVGVWGFILGSTAIGASQAWKVHRIGRGGGPPSAFSMRGLVASRDSATSCGVEAGACVGALCYLVGTAMFRAGPLDGPNYAGVLGLWVAGGACFTVGGGFLAFRRACRGRRRTHAQARASAKQCKRTGTS